MLLETSGKTCNRLQVDHKAVRSASIQSGRGRAHEEKLDFFTNSELADHDRPPSAHALGIVKGAVELCRSGIAAKASIDFRLRGTEVFCRLCYRS